MLPKMQIPKGTKALFMFGHILSSTLLLTPKNLLNSLSTLKLQKKEIGKIKLFFTAISLKSKILKAFGEMSSVTEMYFESMDFMHITNFVKFNKQMVILHVAGGRHIDAAYLKLILKRYTHVKQMDFSKAWIVDRIVVDAIVKYIGDVSVVLPKYLKKSEYVRNLPPAAVRNIKFA